LLDRKARYIPTLNTLYNWYKNKEAKYTVASLDDVRNNYKKSDTIFILGGSESINDITKKQWDHIAKHDSIAMNWWPLHKFTPTYYYTNYPRDKVHFAHFQSVLESKLKNYKKTVFFVSGNRAVRRGIHPRVVRSLYPDSATCCFYDYPEPVKLEKSAPIFNTKCFERTIYYRGGLSLILDLAYKLGYKNIILMGIDLRNSVHFYDGHPEMQWQYEKDYSMPLEVNIDRIHATMDTKKGSKLAMSEYLYVLDDHVFKPKGINCYVGSTKSILVDKIPLYRFPS
jgi:hypothetical protein